LQGLVDIKGVRCRVRASGIVIELETGTDITPQQAFVQTAIQIATDNFKSAGFTDIAANVSVEPYQRGSAFLIETLAVES
jgi:hypothetical protein